MRNYPHMNDSNYPDLESVDVWKFQNNFPYQDFDSIQMRITVCAVPWDVGLIHVGNAQIGGLGNVVDFGSEAARDEWFESLTDKHFFATEYRKFHMEGKGGAVDGTIKLPMPYDVLARYNYAIVEYDPMPVNLEGQGVKKWFYFIRESFMKAPNTTEVELILDAWQTFIYGMKIPYMMLERGHAPMVALSANDFLSNPIENTRYITGEDVTYDDAPSVLKTEQQIVFNDGDTVYACIVIDAAIGGAWGKYRETWRMPSTSRLTNQGTPNYSCICIDAQQFNDFLTDVDYSFPQFKQAVKAVFFASDKMISLGSEIAFSGYKFNYASANYKTFELLELQKSSFGYDAKYADIAKLYTYPYAHIEIMNEMGETNIVRVEDTTGKLDISSSLNTVYPFIKLTANVLGVGGSDSRSVYFKHIGGRAMRYGGRWQTVALNWDVPTFAVVQSNNITYDYSTHFDRVQRRNDATTAKQIADRNADTAKANADASADTAKANADASADNDKTNADNTALVAWENSYASAANAETNSHLLADAAWNNTYADADTIISNANVDATANDTNKTNRESYNNQSTRFSNAYNSRSRNIANDLTMTLKGIGTEANRESAGIAAIGGAVGAALSLSPSSAIQTATEYMQAGVSIHATEEEAEAQCENNDDAYESNVLNASEVNLLANFALGQDRDVENTRIRALAANQAATAKANANRIRTANKTSATNTRNTEEVNADNTYENDLAVNANNQRIAKSNAFETNKTAKSNSIRTENAAKANATDNYNNALADISNDVQQAVLAPVNTFGEISNGDTATTRPLAVFAQVVTQSAGAIAATGDEMLRFGYHCAMQWQFETWNLMKHFTYWKVADLWIDDFRLPDAYADRIRYTLMGGVTVWRSPDIIGKTSIYENMRG